MERLCILQKTMEEEGKSSTYLGYCVKKFILRKKNINVERGHLVMGFVVDVRYQRKGKAREYQVYSDHIWLEMFS